MSSYDKPQPALAEFRAFTADARECAESLDKDELVSLMVSMSWEKHKLEKELTLSNTALDMVKDENEVNKKNMRIFQDKVKELEEDLKEKKLIIDCHLAEMEFTNCSALEEPHAFNDFIKANNTPEQYKKIYEMLDMDEFLTEQ